MNTLIKDFFRKDIVMCIALLLSVLQLLLFPFGTILLLDQVYKRSLWQDLFIKPEYRINKH